MKIISTIPPYAPYISEAASHPLLSGIRLNTVMPLKGEIEENLARLQNLISPKTLWIDLKCRQIRTGSGSRFFRENLVPTVYEINGKNYILDPSKPAIFGSAVSPPWATIPISHKIKLDLTHGPVKCWFQDGMECAQIVEVVDGNKLIMLDGPNRLVGEGEAINISDPSLEVEGYLTDTDIQYIQTAKEIGLHNYMLSFVEQDSDITDLLEIDPDAIIVAKIESQKGLDWATSEGQSKNLMVARGDLYVELGRADRIISAQKKLIKVDKNAILASRILPSLRKNPRPSCSDVTDLACAMEMGYRTFMVGDDICFNRDLLLLAMDIIEAVGKNYK